MMACRIGSTSGLFTSRISATEKSAALSSACAPPPPSSCGPAAASPSSAGIAICKQQHDPALRQLLLERLRRRVQRHWNGYRVEAHTWICWTSWSMLDLLTSSSGTQSRPAVTTPSHPAARYPGWTIPGMIGTPDCCECDKQARETKTISCPVFQRRTPKRSRSQRACSWHCRLTLAN